MSSSHFTFPFWHNQRDIISTLRSFLVERQTNRLQLIKRKSEARQEKGESYKFIHFRDVGLCHTWHKACITIRWILVEVRAHYFQCGCPNRSSSLAFALGCTIVWLTIFRKYFGFIGRWILRSHTDSIYHLRRDKENIKPMQRAGETSILTFPSK